LPNQPGNLAAESLGACPPEQQVGPRSAGRNAGKHRAATHGVISASKSEGINMSTNRAAPGHYLIASDFDQTLSFNDSGLVLSELIGVPNFREKVAGLSDIHLVQQGAELTYLLRHDPEFRCVSGFRVR
jgi:hypothetical protein